MVLPSTGIGLVFGIAVYVFAMDLGEYLFHRAQHAIPFLWAMHSLHHSDTDFNTTTTVRHFWLDSWIKSITIWLAVGVLLKASPLIVGAYGVFSYYNFLTHANLRLNFRGASWIFNSPAYHRLHHSSSREHFDVNYAALLPVFDVLSGAYRRPRLDEHTDTGLDTGDKPQSLLQAIVWPLRGVFSSVRAMPRGTGRVAD
ncbi:MAG TPA: sterol desaturase family protein [Rhizomicrobium sp.]